MVDELKVDDYVRRMSFLLVRLPWLGEAFHGELAREIRQMRVHND